MGLVNDNFVGYLDPWIYEHDITWMEKTVATPFWTGMTLFSIDRKATHRRQKHNLLDTIYEGRGRVLFKGQLFSAPMDWPAAGKIGAGGSARSTAGSGRSLGRACPCHHRRGIGGSQ